MLRIRQNTDGALATAGEVWPTRSHFRIQTSFFPPQQAGPLCTSAAKMGYVMGTIHSRQTHGITPAMRMRVCVSSGRMETHSRVLRRTPPTDLRSFLGLMRLWTMQHKQTLI